jgi:alkylation response protein AidB-like acyl-CoA dehydrogenase
MNFDLPEDVQALVAKARAFREERLDPLEEQFLRDGNVPWPLRPQLQAEARDCGLWARERTTWGRPIASRQAVQFMLADSAVELDAARLLVYRTAWLADRGADVRTDALKAKLYATEMAQRVTDRCLQVFGGRGYAKDSPIQSFFRQVRLWRIGHGTAEIHRWMIARDLLGPAADDGGSR